MPERARDTSKRVRKNVDEIRGGKSLSIFSQILSLNTVLRHWLAFTITHISYIINILVHFLYHSRHFKLSYSRKNFARNINDSSVLFKGPSKSWQCDS